MKIVYKKSTVKNACKVVQLSVQSRIPTLKEIHFALTQFPGIIA